MYRLGVMPPIVVGFHWQRVLADDPLVPEAIDFVAAIARAFAQLDEVSLLAVAGSAQTFRLRQRGA